MNPDEELRHLLNESNSEDVLEEVGIVIFKISCADNALLVLQRCKEVMQLILDHQMRKWPSEEEWYKLLPKWFIGACAPEKTLEEDEDYLEKWRQLSPQEQMLLEESPWSIMEWVSWFEPSEDSYNQRCWFWWNAFIKDANTLVIAVAVVDFPTPYGSLFWLLKASGAIKIEEANE
jgi:hypothetical protein